MNNANHHESRPCCRPVRLRCPERSAGHGREQATTCVMPNRQRNMRDGELQRGMWPRLPKPLYMYKLGRTGRMRSPAAWRGFTICARTGQGEEESRSSRKDHVATRKSEKIDPLRNCPTQAQNQALSAGSGQALNGVPVLYVDVRTIRSRFLPE